MIFFMNGLIKQLNFLIDRYQRQNKTYKQFVENNRQLVKIVVDKFFKDNWRLEIYYRSFKFFVRIWFQKALYLIDKEINKKYWVFVRLNVNSTNSLEKNTKSLNIQLDFMYLKKFLSEDELDEKIIDLLVEGYTKKQIAQLLKVSRPTVYKRLKRMRDKLIVLYENY